MIESGVSVTLIIAIRFFLSVNRSISSDFIGHTPDDLTSLVMVSNAAFVYYVSIAAVKAVNTVNGKQNQLW